jgi:23S rRNA (adenine2503-C2)-methyltransferase
MEAALLSPGIDFVEELDRRLTSVGATPRQLGRVWRAWLAGAPLAARAHGTDAPFSRRLMAELEELERELGSLARVVERRLGDDGAERLGLCLADGRRVEAVRLPSGSACLSSQVGCAVGCLFCATGTGGLGRNLSVGEILGTFAAIARPHGARLRRALFMGMGEPAHNAAAVLAACEVLALRAGLGRENVVVSSVGDRRLFERLAQSSFRPALALSLHAGNDELRRRLLPRAPTLPLVELVELAEAYAESTRYPIQYQWTLLAGVNDSDEELLAAVPLLAGKRAVLNLIPWNPLASRPFGRPDLERCRAAVRLLMRRGILTKLRWSAGLGAEAACGQLVAVREIPGSGGTLSQRSG